MDVQVSNTFVVLNVFKLVKNKRRKKMNNSDTGNRTPGAWVKTRNVATTPYRMMVKKAHIGLQTEILFKNFIHFKRI